MAQSLRKAGSNIKDLSSFPDFEVNLNLESLLTLDVENQHAVTHFEIENLRERHHGVHVITGIKTHTTLLHRRLPLASSAPVNRRRRFSPAPINVTITVAAKLETVSLTRILPTRAVRQRMLTRKKRDFL